VAGAAFENERPRALLHAHQPCVALGSLLTALEHMLPSSVSISLPPHWTPSALRTLYTLCLCSSSEMLRRCIVWGTYFSADHFQPLPWRGIRAGIGSRPPFCAHHGASSLLVARLDVGAHSQLHHCQRGTKHRSARFVRAQQPTGTPLRVSHRFLRLPCVCLPCVHTTIAAKASRILIASVSSACCIWLKSASGSCSKGLG
jgi:hypothetical protein